MLVFTYYFDISPEAFNLQLFICFCKWICSFAQIVTVYNHKSNLSSTQASPLERYNYYQQWLMSADLCRMRSRLLLLL